jgi:hypothetical protein
MAPAEQIRTVDQLRQVLGHPIERVRNKVRNTLHLCDVAWIAASPYVFVATSDRRGGCDVSPKGDPRGSFLVLDEHTLVIPERPGNRRGDGFLNILENPNVGLIFIVPGRDDTLRVNGGAALVTDGPFFERLDVGGHRPSLAMVVHVDEVFAHCPRPSKRASLWDMASWNPEAAPSRLTFAKLVERPDDDPDELAAYYESPSYGTNLYGA